MRCRLPSKPPPAASQPPDGQAFRFKYIYKPESVGLDKKDTLGIPVSGRRQPTGHVSELTNDEPLLPQDTWDPQGEGSLALPNPSAQRFRIKQVPLPVPVSFPGSDYWEVEVLHDYSKEWPRVEKTDAGWHLRRGFLGPIADPKLVPFFFYRGLEQVRYSVGDRAFQLIFAAAYTAVHAAAFAFIWASDPSLSLAVALNWALGRLSAGKWALLLTLGVTGRVWLYWVFQAGKLVDKGLAKLAPPIRRFFWANFALWMIYLALSPAHWYPIPFWPFAPGSMGVQEAFQ